MEAIDELAQLSDSMQQAAAVLADEDVDETSRSSRRPSTFLNVVALGNIGAGKSAVLNSLIGHPALPTGEGGATRAPICIDLNRDDTLSSKSIVLQIDSKSQSVSASALRKSLQDRLSKTLSKNQDEIYLKLRTSTVIEEHNEEKNTTKTDDKERRLINRRLRDIEENERWRISAPKL